ncbi:Gfo/Idh/MocA family protein [Salinibius halmophilus]|uniref:Gfo/Idh/MocA family protein n=1 Tax=Salinibius halmophilus TaxID=1853216 RepID=UPI0013143F4B|nr:Gfo/Idh/MocA family oxidoreductase [Salinibius halmophilus]
MKIVMVGIGDIANKAWLPAVNELTHLDACLVVRKAQHHDAIRQRWHLPVYQSLQTAIAEHRPNWVTIHAATNAHFDLAYQALSAGVSVLVDKPIATSFEQVQTLQNLAKQNSCYIVCAFNRRTADLYQQLKSFGGNAWQISKHRHNLPGEIQTFLYDDFIHVLDTLLWWTEQPTFMQVTVLRDDNNRVLDLAVNWLQSDQRVFGEMSRRAGGDQEWARVVGANRLCW